MKGLHPKSPNSYPQHRPYDSPPAKRRQRAVPDVVSKYYIPLPVLEATNRAMRRFGVENRECYVWWGGYFNSHKEGQVLTALCPEISSDYGHIRLGSAELGALHSRLRSLDQVLLAELHTHPPGAGGQNEVDAAYPAVTYPGFISIVVPDFASPRFYDLRNAYVYEYIGTNQWHQLEIAEIENRFVIEESFLSVKV